MSDQRDERLDPVNEGMSEEKLDAFVTIGRQLAAKMAEANFRIITSRPSWTMTNVEAEIERAIERIEINSRDLVTAQGADPDGENWRTIWTAMECGYRQRMMDLLRVSGVRIGEKLQ